MHHSETMDSIHKRQDQQTLANRVLVQEYAIAIVINGLNYAVMMLSPNDLEDFIRGFLLTEQIIEQSYDIHDINIQYDQDEMTGVIEVEIANRCIPILKEKSRQVKGTSGCGICGVKALAQALPKLPALSKAAMPVLDELIALKTQLPKWQTKGMTSGAMHAAFLVVNKEVVACREDIGRHNALDKLLGCKLTLTNLSKTEDIMVLVTSRCSVELVNKAVIGQIGTLVSLASPSQLAVKTAQSAQLNLIHIPKYDQPLCY